MVDYISRCIENPSVQKLKQIKERNPYHNEASVFEHTMDVLNAIPDSIEYFISLKPESKNHFSSNIGSFVRSELLRVTAIFHDVGKYMPNQPIIEHAYGHDKTGSDIALQELTELGFDSEETDYVSFIVRNHMRPFNYLTSLHTTENPTRLFNRMRKKLGDNYLDVLVHSFADIVGSNTTLHLEPINKNDGTCMSDKDHIIKLFGDYYVTNN